MKKVAEKGLASTANNNDSYLYQDVGSSWRRRDKDHPPVPTFCIGNATKNNAVFLYYPIVNITEASKESEGNGKVKASWMGWGIGFGLRMRNQSSSTGGDRSAALEEIPVVLRPDEYTFCDMACGVKEHSQMHIRIGVLKHMTGEGSGAKGKFQLLDVRKIGGNKVLVLRQPCLTKPVMYREIDWPCAAKDIRELSGGRTESDGQRENGFWKLPSPFWIGASLATAVIFYPAIVSFLPFSTVVPGFVKSEAVD